MKKFVSMAMVAAMTVSMVPATAFAGDSVDATAKIVNAWTVKDSDSKAVKDGGVKTSAPELQLKITDASTQGTLPQTGFEFTVELDGASFDLNNDGKLDASEIATLESGMTFQLDSNGTVTSTPDVAGTDYVEATDAQITAALEAIYDEHLGGTAYTGTIIELAPATVTANNSGASPAFAPLSPVATLDKAGAKNDLSVTDPTGIVSKVPAATNEQDAADAWVAVFMPAYDTATSTNMLVNGAVVAGYELSDSTSVASPATQFVATETIIDWVEDSTVDSANATDKVTQAIKDTVKNGKFVDTPAKADKTKAEWVADAKNELTVKTSGDKFYVAKSVVKTAGNAAAGAARNGLITASVTGWEADDVEEITITINCGVDSAGNQMTLVNGDIFKMDLTSLRDKAKNAYVSVTSDDFNISNDSEDLLYVAVEGEGITVTTKDVAVVAEEEKANIKKDIKIKSTVGNFGQHQLIHLRLSNGFEFASLTADHSTDYTVVSVKDDEAVIKVANLNDDELIIDARDMVVEATSAKSGSAATLKVKAEYDSKIADSFSATAALEVMKVVDYTVVMSVDADEDVPVIYSGTDVDNTGLTDDSDHLSLEVTIEETFPGAWSMRQGFNLELPDGVYVTNVDVKSTSDFYYEDADKKTQSVGTNEWEEAFWNAYQKGDHKGFKFEKRVFNDVDTSLYKDAAEVTFELELVADPTFVGDVNLKLTGNLVDEQEVTVAKFVPAYTVKAEQNDMKIDYRYTAIPTDITITEAEAGLWDADEATFGFYIEKDLLTFEDDPTYTVDGASGMELADDEITTMYVDDRLIDVMAFTVDKESDEAATITISDMELFMNRNIPAGPYDLKMATSMGAAYLRQMLYAPDELAKCDIYDGAATAVVSATDFGLTKWEEDDVRPSYKEDTYVDDIADFSSVAKEAFVNIVTAGREQDDASFTTKVVVPVGESYIVAGEHQVTLDVPAYVSEAGYTMLPVRAVATALGINNNNVIWNGETKTVTILYGQRIITMAAGEKAVHVNGSVIPASAAVEIVDGRTFLPMRDLATALGVTDITWDAATKTATLNGNA